MKKYIFTALAALAMAVPAVAEEVGNAVLIHEVSGNTVEYLFSESPVATFDGDDLVMTAAGEAVRYPMANVERITLRITDMSRVEEIDGLVSIRVSSALLEINGMTPGAEVSVIDLNGIRLAGGIADASGRFSADLSGLGSGVYMVVTKERTFKFVK